ncbi:MAG TPA: amidohydrolase [Acidimicrobiales bacterium]
MNAGSLYINGLIFTGSESCGVRDDTSTIEDAPTAIAVDLGRVVAVGSTEDVLAFARPDSAITDLGGRRVIPGLIDAHLHAVRAGATWNQELHWTGVRDIASALASIRRAAASAMPNTWIRVVGGWHPSQFIENRVPTRSELDDVSGDHPVYVQALYESAILNSEGLKAVGFDAPLVDSTGGVELSPNGEPTGVITGMVAFAACLAVMEPSSGEEKRSGTAAMLRQLHALGLTGIVDPGGFNMPPESYDSLFDLWRGGELTMRMRLFVSAVDAGKEYEQLNAWLRHAHSHFGDDMLRLVGIGEVVHYGCHDFEGLASDFYISPGARGELLAISRRTAERGWPMHIHAVLDSSIDVILDCWEQVNEEFPLRGLRFSLVHVDTISTRNIARLEKLGVGVVVDDHLVFKAALSEQAWGTASLRRAPPLLDLLDAGVPVAAGTDANRASSFNPWLALWWLIAGRSLDGVVRRDEAQRMTRTQALVAYTSGSAWLSSEEDDRGHLRVGARADFAVLDADYFNVPLDEIPWISADLTVVGGREVYSNGSLSDTTPKSGANLSTRVLQ